MITNTVSTVSLCEDHAGLFDYVSPTRLNTWLTCPLKFNLRYLDGIKEQTSPSLFLGNRVHDGLEFFYRGRQTGASPSPADVFKHMRESWEEAAVAEQMTFDSLSNKRLLLRQAIGLVETYLDEWDMEEGTPVLVGSPLDCPLTDPGTGEDLGVRIHTFADLVLDSPNGFIVVDFKTAARSSAPLEVSHEVQLSSQAYAFRHVSGDLETELQIRRLIKTKTPKYETHCYPARTDLHFRRLVAIVRAYLDDLHSGRFVYRPTWMCSMCDYRETNCRQWLGQSAGGRLAAQKG